MSGSKDLGPYAKVDKRLYFYLIQVPVPPFLHPRLDPAVEMDGSSSGPQFPHNITTA